MPGLDDARIRLEGALEIVESGTSRYRAARECLSGSDWNQEVDASRDFFRKLIGSEDPLEVAAEKALLLRAPLGAFWRICDCR